MQVRARGSLIAEIGGEVVSPNTAVLMNKCIEGRVIVHRTAVRVSWRSLQNLEQKIPQCAEAFAVHGIEMGQMYGLVDHFPAGHA